MSSRLLAVVTLLFTFYSFITAQSTKWISARLSSQPLQIVELEERSFSNNVTYLYSIDKDQIAYLGFGFSKLKENGWFQEFSLVNMNISRQKNIHRLIFINQQVTEPLDGTQIAQASLALRWEFGKLLGSIDKQRLIPAFGVSIDPYANFTHIIPYTNMFFEGKFLRVGSVVNVIPKVEYSITKNMSLDVSFPVPVVNVWLSHDKIKHPAIRENSQNKVDHCFFPVRDTQIRIGLLYKISNQKI